MDFTLTKYQSLLRTLVGNNYNFQSFQKFIEEAKNNSIILRHDVDKLPQNSLLFAQIQHDHGIKGSYYFRIVPESFNPGIIENIAKLGHEIGYHYEDVDFASQNLKIKDQSQKTKEEIDKLLADKAIELFEKNLETLRKYYPVKTICMHGSPLSKYDNKLLWKYYNYHDYGIIGEPYFDIDFNEVFYLTDTGRRWDGDRVSVRDKVNKKRSGESANMAIERLDEPVRILFRSTRDIIESIEEGTFPNSVMFTFHPQRWTDNPVLWLKELLLQNVKNQVKRLMIKR